jgi:two-component system response regulator BaeR
MNTFNNTSTSTRILIVEDEEKLAALLRDYLQQAGYQTHCVFRGDEVDAVIKQWNPDAILLDVMLPGKDGMTICRELRSYSSIPVLMLTARVEEIDRLLGLELGADDYICKPFSPREVIARLKAVLRRCSNPATSSTPSQVRLDEHRLEIHYGDTALALTSIEYQLLKTLATEPGRIWSRQQLMDRIYPDNRVVSDRTIDSHVKKLRKKLAETFPDINLVQSVYGVGYRYEEPESNSSSV